MEKSVTKMIIINNTMAIVKRRILFEDKSPEPKLIFFNIAKTHNDNPSDFYKLHLIKKHRRKFACSVFYEKR